MNPGRTQTLLAGLFDDAAMFPPAALDLATAAPAHVGHRLSWYADMVGPFVCSAGRLVALDERVRALGQRDFEVTVVVPDGIDAVPAALATLDRCSTLRLRGLEVPLRDDRFPAALRLLEPVRARCTVFLEIPVLTVTERQVHELAAAGIQLKLRTGGTRIDAFRTEGELAGPIVLCAAERLPFKCTAGLHNAVRHRDSTTLFEHHGFLNVAIAARVAAGTGNREATTAALGERDPSALVARVQEFDAVDIAAIRALFTSFGTCSISEPIDDLLAMGLVRKP